MSIRRPLPSWSQPPQHAWHLDEIKQGNLIATHSLNDAKVQPHISNGKCCSITFGRIADDPTLVDIVTAHESCSRLHARIAFDQNGTPWLRDLGSGNGTFVNERRLPPEACGKELDGSNSNQKGSRGVVLYPGDAIRFGASTRIYILEGPEEFERGAIKLKNKLMKETAATAQAEAVSNNSEEATPQAKEDGCSWGMADDITPTDEEPKAQAIDNSNLPPLPSIESFFYSTKYKIPNNLHTLHSQYNTKMHKLQSIQTESQRIMQKENMGVELTEGQRNQLNKNQERIVELEKAVTNLKERIEDGMHIVIHGKDRVKKQQKEQGEYNTSRDDDVDDFFDRTASTSSKRKRGDDEAESEESLILKWKSLLQQHAYQQRTVTRASDRCKVLQKQIDNMKEDDEDAFFLQNDLTLAIENMTKAKKSLEETEKSLDETEYLLKIVNPKLIWDRKEGLIGTDINKTRKVEEKEVAANDSVPGQGVAVDNVECDSIMMPPPPPAIATDASLSMPPPPPMAAVTASSKPALPEQQRVHAPMRPPTDPVDSKTEEMASMPPPMKPEFVVEQQKKKKQRGPMRPPTNIQGTLAALKQATSQSTPTSNNGVESSASSKKKAPMVSNPFDPQKDEWSAPANQDGSGRTALHDKFKGRY